MADYNLVQIGSTYFTDDGLVTGIPCRIETVGLDGAALDWTGSIVKSGDGTPYAFILNNSAAGVELSLRPLVILSAEYTAIKVILNDAADNETTITLGITGDTGTFSFNCIPRFPKPIEHPGKMVNGRIYDSSINLVIVSTN